MDDKEDEKDGENSDETDGVPDDGDDLTDNGPSTDSEPESAPVEVLGPEQAFGGMQMGGGGPVGGQDRFLLRDPVFWSGGLRILALIALGYWAAVVAPDAVTYGVDTIGLIELIGIPVFVAGALLVRKWRLPDDRQAIEFKDDGVRLPKGADKASTTWVDYTELRSVVMLSRGQGEMIMIDTDGGRYTYSDGEFAQPQGARRVREELMQRIRNHPDGDTILQRIEDIEELARAASRNPTNVTYGLLGLIGAIFLYEYFSGALSGNQYQLIEMGANSAPLIAEGQWWRLISANFLHGGWTHILLNGIALFFLGIATERLVGSWRFLGIFLISALGGAVGSYLFTEAPLSVGSSTALFGLIAAFGVLHIKYWRKLPPPYRQSITWWVVILGLNIGISFLPFVDAAGHFGGLFAGAAATYVALIGMPEINPQQEPAGWWRVVTGLFILLFAVGGGLAISHAMDSHPKDMKTLLTYQIERGLEQKDAQKLNRAAWIAAIDPNASRDQLETAKKAASRAVELEDRPEFQDTLATVNYRLGLKAAGEARQENLGRAVDVERSVLADVRHGGGASEDGGLTEVMPGGAPSHPDGYYATQLARFVEAYANEFGVYRRGQPLADDAALTLTRSAGHSAVEVDLKAAGGRDVEVFGLATRDKNRLGLFYVCVPSGMRGGTVETFGDGGRTLTLSEDAHLRKVYTATDDVDCRGDDLSGDYWPTESQVARLP